MKNWLMACKFWMLTLVLGTVGIACGDDEPTPAKDLVPEKQEEVEVPVDFDRSNEIVGTIRNISSKQLVAEMGVGWNLGNSFDVRSKDKTFWGNPLSTSAHVDAVKAMGFTTLRIPITWNYDQLQFAPYSIEPEYLARVQTIVNAALNNDMHVIINTHHDDWIVPTNAKSEEVKSRLASIWTQVGTFFQNYGDRLIFETMNEPRLEGSPEEWTGGTQEGRDQVNAFHQAAVDAIRATGGNNSKRHLMLATYAASSTPNAMRDLVVPNNDPNVIISIHSYYPWSFAGDETGPSTWGTANEKQSLLDELDRIRERWIVQEDRAVILGEWGTTNKNNLSSRVAYSSFYTAAAVERDFVPIIWDDGGNFGFYDRHGLKWKYPEIAEAVIAAGNK